MCKQLSREEQLQRMADRSLAQPRNSFREQLKRLAEEVTRTNESEHRPENCEECRDEQEAQELILTMERDTKSFAVQRTYIIPRDFVWSHYQSECDPNTCSHGGLSLHGVENFAPNRLKGSAKVLYDELSGPYYGFEVEIIPTSTRRSCNSFALRITW